MKVEISSWFQFEIGLRSMYVCEDRDSGSVHDLATF
jgi:hypothetical protein